MWEVGWGNPRVRVLAAEMGRDRLMAPETQMEMQMILGGECEISPSEVDEEGHRWTQAERPG